MFSTSYKYCISSNMYAVCSVTGFGEIRQLWQHFKSNWLMFRGYSVSWTNYRTNFLKKLDDSVQLFVVNNQWLKNLVIWSHWWFVKRPTLCKLCPTIDLIPNWNVAWYGQLFILFCKPQIVDLTYVSKGKVSWAVVVAQLAEWLCPRTQDPGSNLTIS